MVLMMVNDGWLIPICWLVVLSTPLKNDGVKDSWDDDIPNWMESHKIPWFQTTNQLFEEVS